MRRQQRLKQSDLVGQGRSRYLARLLEAGRATDLRLGDIRAHFAKMGATVHVSAWWNGASLDRLLDERHAGVVNGAMQFVQPHGWSAHPEVTFAEWGERGSMDVFAAHEATRSIFIGEAKSEWGSIEETLRRLDVKVRLAPTVAKRRFGWTPVSVGVALIFPEDATARRVARRYAAILDSAFPARNREVRRWLRKPFGPLRGLWFLSDVHPSNPTDG